MHGDLSARIQQYLQLETSYAVVINGGYGLGKTHYVKNELFPLVSKLAVIGSKEEAYIPIHVSLFGLTSIEEIEDQIFFELFPLLKSTGAKIVTGVTKAAMRWLSGSDLSDFVKDSGITGSKLVDYKRVVIFIDDIDRKNPELDISSFFGFVNNLVENLGAKIILITNESKLSNNISQPDYSVLREKVIGISINFPVNTKQSFDIIVESKYLASYPEYYQFLISKKDELVQRIDQNDGNLRNLLFVLEHFKLIFKYLGEVSLQEEKMRDAREAISGSILTFMIPIAIEYKMARLNSENIDSVKDVYRGARLELIRLMSGNKDTKQEKSYAELYSDKYLKRFKPKYLESVFEFVVGAAALSKDQLRAEVVKEFLSQENSTTEGQKNLKKLEYWECVDLSDGEYRRLTYETLKIVDRGEYTLEESILAFYYAIRFGNILKLDVPKLLKRVKSGIKRGIPRYNYTRRIFFKYTIDHNTEFREEILDLIDYCKEINQQLSQKIKDEKREDYWSLFSTDLAKFFDVVGGDESNFINESFFDHYGVARVWKVLCRQKNTLIVEFAFFIRERYSGHSSRLLPELDFLRGLSAQIAATLERKNVQSMKVAALMHLMKYVKDAISVVDFQGRS